MLFGRQVLPIASIAKLEHGHITVKEIQVVLEVSQWTRYFKFAFVRNPFDRFISACAFLNRGNPQFKQRPNEWMKVALTRTQFRNRLLIRPQSEQLIDTDGRLAMDFIGRYESLQRSLNDVFEHLSLPNVVLDVRNSSDHEQYREYYDDALKGEVTRLYQQDLDAFGYTF